jgi:hypothetical protein
LAVVVFIAARPSTPSFELPEGTVEITETDIFADLEKIDAHKTAVKGVMLGDTEQEVIQKIGIPDSQLAPKPNILNMEYGIKFGLQKTGLIIQLRDNQVRKITFKKPFNKFLKGKTKIIHTKDNMYINVLGKPDEIFFIPETPTSVKAFRLFQYKDLGVEVMIDKDKQTGFTITDVFDSPT